MDKYDLSKPEEAARLMRMAKTLCPGFELVIVFAGPVDDDHDMVGALTSVEPKVASIMLQKALMEMVGITAEDMEVRQLPEEH